MNLNQEKSSNYLLKKEIKNNANPFDVVEFVRAYRKFMTLPAGIRLNNLGLLPSYNHLQYHRAFKTDFEIVKKLLKIFTLGTEQDKKAYMENEEERLAPDYIRIRAQKYVDELAEYGMTYNRLVNYRLEREIKSNYKNNLRKEVLLQKIFDEDNIEEKNRWKT